MTRLVLAGWLLAAALLVLAALLSRLRLSYVRWYREPDPFREPWGEL